MKMTLLNTNVTYRAVELVFDSNIDTTCSLVSEAIKSMFANNGFKHATLVVDIKNPSKEKF